MGIQGAAFDRNKVLPDLKSQDIQGSLNHARYDPSPTDRATAAWLGWTVEDYMESNEAGELPDISKLPPQAGVDEGG